MRTFAEQKANRIKELKSKNKNENNNEGQKVKKQEK